VSDSARPTIPVPGGTHLPRPTTPQSAAALALAAEGRNLTDLACHLRTELAPADEAACLAALAAIRDARRVIELRHGVHAVRQVRP
jgi:hypothetical protein